ncbi:MAG: S4 domain-containing protein [Desulfotalea sp.]
MTEEIPKMRLDKWLWAARFFKTRSLASQAVNGGKVHLNGNRVKAARAVVVGDTLVIGKAQMEFVIVVLGLAPRRGPASVAQKLYEESADSISKREEGQQLRKALNVSHSPPASKPSKRDRRKIIEFVRKD